MKLTAISAILLCLILSSCDRNSAPESIPQDASKSSITSDELLRAVGGDLMTVTLPDSHSAKDGFSLVRVRSDGSTEKLIGSYWPHQEAGSQIRMSIVPTRNGEIRIVVFTLDGTSISSSHSWGNVDWAVFPDSESRWNESIVRFYPAGGATIPSLVIQKPQLSEGEFDLRFVTEKPNQS